MDDHDPSNLLSGFKLSNSVLSITAQFTTNLLNPRAECRSGQTLTKKDQLKGQQTVEEAATIL